MTHLLKILVLANQLIKLSTDKKYKYNCVLHMADQKSNGDEED